MIPTGVQDWIHKLEEGEGAKYLKGVLALIVFVALATFYDVRQFQNFKNPEAMDSAQIARNLADGKGYTTKFLRPFAFSLMQKHTGSKDILKKEVPDISNAPGYPALTAGLFKIAPVRNAIGNPGNFTRYQPEVMIAILNQGLFLAAVMLVFKIGRTLFDLGVAWVAAGAFATTDLYWRFSVSGLSTVFLIVLFLSLVLTLLAMERGLREQTMSQAKLITYAALAGVLLGGMALTRYSMAVLILPVLGFLAWIGGPKRIPIMVLPALILLGSLGSWAYRNYELSGTPFGTAGFAVFQETPQMPGNKLERSMPKNLTLELDKVGLSHVFRKLMVESAELLKNAVPRLGESWMAAFFLVSLLVSFKSEAIKKLRIFSIVTMILLLMAQAVGKTSLSEAAPDVNSENLLAVFAPLAFIFGAAMFFILLDAIEWSIPPLRPIIAGGFVLICSAPLIFLLLPPRESPISYPPYYPPLIQETASWLEPNEMMMSDMPWAIAWYGNRKCIWTTLDSGSDSQGDFFAINDYQKPINALFLSPLTMDSKFLTEMIQGKEGAWGRFVLDGLLKTNVPTGFPLKQAPRGFLPAHLYLSDRARWKNTQK